MGERIDGLFDETINLIKRYGKCVLKDPNCDVEEEWNNISPCMMYVCDEVHKQCVSYSTFQNFLEEIEVSCELMYDVEDNDVLAKFKTDVEKNYSYLELGENNKTYKEFKNLMLSKISKKHDESDVTAVSENVNLVDPITKLRLTDPVKNLICGHVYEKPTILQLLMVKKKVKCPIPGCVAVSHINEKDLVPDIALKRFLDQNP